MKKNLIQFAALLLIITAVRAQEPSNIQLEQREGRTWLVDSNGQPFFAHGVTHIGTSKHGVAVTRIAQACKDLGFNAYGYGCPEELKSDLPYVEGFNHLVPMSLYRTSDSSFSYVDIFDPKVQARLTAGVKRICLINRDNPKLIGYCWTDLGAWPLQNTTGKNWVEFIRALPAEAPGQKAYRKFLETRQEDNKEQASARDLAFLRLIAREYFRVLGEANRKFDPKHLIFGDRFTFQTAIPEVLEEILPYVDAIAIQPRFKSGFPAADFKRIHELSNKPILVCDFAVRFKEAGKKIRGWKPEENATIAGEHYAAYVREAMATPYILGVFWCNPMNSDPGFLKTGIKQGLFDRGLVPRPGLNQAVRELNEYRVKVTPGK